MAKYKHLSLDERILIQQMLGQAASFKAIARTLGRNCSTISKEVRNHLVFQKKGCMGHAFNHKEGIIPRRSAAITNL